MTDGTSDKPVKNPTNLRICHKQCHIKLSTMTLKSVAELSLRQSFPEACEKAYLQPSGYTSIYSMVSLPSHPFQCSRAGDTNTATTLHNCTNFYFSPVWVARARSAQTRGTSVGLGQSVGPRPPLL